MADGLVTDQVRVNVLCFLEPFCLGLAFSFFRFSFVFQPLIVRSPVPFDIGRLINRPPVYAL
jgi:hypothetical protein